MWTDNASEIDMLFYKPYADIVSEAAMGMDQSSLTIGVFGFWGAGKSTLLNLIEKNYKDNKDVICVTINAWMFENYEDAKSAIMEALLRELQSNERLDQKIKDKLGSLIKKIDFLKIGTKTATIAAPFVASIATGNPLPVIFSLPKEAEEIETTIKGVASSVKNIREDYLKDNSEDKSSVVNNVRAFRKEFEDALQDKEIKRVIVMVDDLDRCQPERIIETLEAIKLFLAVQKTTFIIAADDNVIQYAIKKKYPVIDGYDVELDKEYIEKMVQVPIQIPELSSKDIQNYLLLLVLQKYMDVDKFKTLIEKMLEKKILVESDVVDIPQLEKIFGASIIDDVSCEKRSEYNEVLSVILKIRSIASQTLKGTPRQVKRFLNTFITKCKLSKMYYGDELDMAIMAKLLILHMINPELLNQLHTWNEHFYSDDESGNKEYRLMKEEVLSPSDDIKYPKWNRPRVVAWVKCEPMELEKHNLDKYFYLTREILSSNDDLKSNLSKASTGILDRISNVSLGTTPNIIKDMKLLTPADLDDVMNIVISRIVKENIEEFFYSALFKEFVDYRKEIVNAILKSGIKVTPQHMTAFSIMYQADSQMIEEMLKEMQDKKLVNASVVRRIKGEKVS